MAEFKSEEVTIAAPREAVFAKLSDTENFKEMMASAPLDQIPEDQRKLIENIEVDSNGITIPGGPVGAVKLAFTKREAPSLIAMEGIGTPVPMRMSLCLAEGDGETTRAQVKIDIEIPMMMRMMVGGPLTKMANEIANMLRQIRF